MEGEESREEGNDGDDEKMEGTLGEERGRKYVGV
jgi:hypothetical protein